MCIWLFVYCCVLRLDTCRPTGERIILTRGLELSRVHAAARDSSCTVAVFSKPSTASSPSYCAADAAAFSELSTTSSPSSCAAGAAAFSEPSTASSPAAVVCRLIASVAPAAYSLDQGSKSSPPSPPSSHLIFFAHLLSSTCFAARTFKIWKVQPSC
ncbi:Os11g0453501 [Oryza sativa Japonica Group]|uniref:Os11g0453501 protein n=1 Tax=Oryza sativa subsp. japonica TaxID=39947 RepID=A0A0P0Y270_ORYSJ|nr:Os11g0453501 [Oryza sativa Japonica Group]